MTTLQKRKLTALCYWIGMWFYPALQTAISASWFFGSEETQNIIICIIAILSGINTIFYQLLSKHIPNVVAITGVVFLALGVCAGVNLIFHILHWSNDFSKFISWTLTIGSTLVQLLSKVIYVPDATTEPK